VEETIYPTILNDLAAPRLRVYPRATVVSEKLEAIVTFGMTNSRMKDYFDLRALAKEGATEEAALTEAIAASFARRGTTIPEELPLGLTDEFARDTAKVTQWKAFLGKNRLDAPSLDVVVADVRAFVEKPLRLARERQARAVLR